MDRDEIIDQATEALCTAEGRAEGRRLALLALPDGGWLIGYQVPGSYPPGMTGPWAVRDWLRDRFGKPLIYDSLPAAWGEAQGLRRVIQARVSARAPAGSMRGELLVVVDDAADAYAGVISDFQPPAIPSHEPRPGDGGYADGT